MAEPKVPPRRPVEILRPSYGSAYRIGGRLVLTAGHLFPAGQGSGCKVREVYSFGTVEAEVVWISPDADVALVALPEWIAVCEPICKPVRFGQLPEIPLEEETIGFTMYGWPQWAGTVEESRVRAGGRRITGRIYLDDTSPEAQLVVLEPGRGPDAPNPKENGSQWSGMSGAAVVCNDLVIAVQHHHQNPHRASSLEATRLSAVYQDEDWRGLLQNNGIDGDPVDVIMMRTTWQEAHCQRVVQVVTQELMALGNGLQAVAAEMIKFAGQQASDINLTCSGEGLAKPFAISLVNYRPVHEVISFLIGLMKKHRESGEAGKIGKIIDYLLPLNYAPHVLDQLRAEADGKPLALVEGEVATRTLAEIIMAGYDQQPSLFDTITAANPDVSGQVALDGEEGPEEGPAGDVGVQLAARNFLVDLIALKDMIPLGQKTRLQPGRHPYRTDIDIVQETLMQQIKGAAVQLRGALRSIGRQNERTVYCVIDAPLDAMQRSFRRDVIELVHEEVPDLIFVELLPAYEAYEREYQLQEDIKFRLIHTQQGSK